MTTNLIFKRSISENGVTKVQTKIVPVDIKGIESGEGWILSGHADEILYDVPKPTKKSKAEKVESNVSGTAKLVRVRGVIKIVARRGKTTYNQSSRNSVCINDSTKFEFFKSCRTHFGQNTDKFEFNPSDGKVYDYWNSVIDTEFQRQKELANSKEN